MVASKKNTFFDSEADEADVGDPKVRVSYKSS